MPNREGTVAPPNFASLFFAFVSTAVALRTAWWFFGDATLPWILLSLAIVVAVIGVALRTREILWMSNLPFLAAHFYFYFGRHGWIEWDFWELAPCLALISLTLGFGIVLWGRLRTRESQGATRAATIAMSPYAIAATLALIATTFHHAPREWMLTFFAVETLAFVVAGILVAEPTFAVMAVATIAVGTGSYLGMERAQFGNHPSAWTNLLVGLLLLVATERLVKLKAANDCFGERARRGLRTMFVVILSGLAIYGVGRLLTTSYLTVSWASVGFVLLAMGFALRERTYRWGGLSALAFSLGRAVFYDLARLPTPFRIISFIGLGLILLSLGYLYTRNREKISKWL